MGEDKFTESMLRDTFIEYLKSEGLTELATEVQTIDLNVHDLIYIDKDRKFVCVEFKLTDWKKVIEQANRIRSWTPLVYVAMPLPVSIPKRDAIEDICKEHGLGLFWFNKYGGWKCCIAPNEKIKLIKGENLFEYFNRKTEQSLYQHYHFTFIAPHLGRAAEISKTVVYKTKKIIW